MMEKERAVARKVGGEAGGGGKGVAGGEAQEVGKRVVVCKLRKVKRVAGQRALSSLSVPLPNQAPESLSSIPCTACNLATPPLPKQVGTDAMNAMAQSKKVEEALGQAVVAGEALKRGLAQEGARGDQVGVERDREEECTEKWTRGLPSRGAHQFAGGHVGRLRIENILANAQSHPRYVSLPQAEGVAADLQRELAETSSSLEEQRGLLKKVGFWGAGGN